MAVTRRRAGQTRRRARAGRGSPSPAPAHERRLSRAARGRAWWLTEYHENPLDWSGIGDQRSARLCVRGSGTACCLSEYSWIATGGNRLREIAAPRPLFGTSSGSSIRRSVTAMRPLWSSRRSGSGERYQRFPVRANRRPEGRTGWSLIRNGDPNACRLLATIAVGHPTCKCLFLADCSS